MITGEQLRRFNPDLPPGIAAIYAASFGAVLAAAGLDQRALRLRHFMAQIAHESAGFRGLTESLGYRDPAHLLATFSSVQTRAHAQHLIAEGPEAIGNWVYANKLGNGNVASRDGYRFRGRGFIMNTGRANYAQVARFTQLPVLDDPALVGTPDVAARAAAMFWTDRRINLAADENDIRAVTRLVNGPRLQGLAERQARYAVAEDLWPDG